MDIKPETADSDISKPAESAESLSPQGVAAMQGDDGQAVAESTSAAPPPADTPAPGGAPPPADTPSATVVAPSKDDQSIDHSKRQFVPPLKTEQKDGPGKEEEGTDINPSLPTTVTEDPNQKKASPEGSQKPPEGGYRPFMP